MRTKKRQRCRYCRQQRLFEADMDQYRNESSQWLLIILSCGLWLIPYGFYTIFFRKPKFYCTHCGERG